MKNKKYRKSIVLLLAVSMLALCGCNSNKQTEEKTTDIAQNQKPGEQNDLTQKQEETEETTNNNSIGGNSDEKTLKWAFVDCTLEISDDIVNKFNAALLERGYDFQVEFVLCPVEEGEDVYETFLHETNGDVDLLYIRNESYTTSGLSYPMEGAAYEYPAADFVREDALLPLDSYLDDELSGLVKNEKDWIKCTYHGKIYGFPAAEYVPWGKSYVVDKEVFDKSGLTFQDLAKDWWELDGALKKLYHANGDKPIAVYMKNTLPFVTSSLKDYDMISYSIGIRDGKAVNIYEQEDIKKLLKAWKRYTEKGYATDKDDTMSVIDCNQISVNGTKVSESIVTDENGTRKEYTIPYGEIKSDRYIDRFSTGISIYSKSEKIDMAIEFIKAIEKDSELGKILSYGIEGKDYEEKNNVIYQKYHVEDNNFFGNIPIYGVNILGQTVQNVYGSGSSMVKAVDSDKYTESDLTTATISEEISPYKDFIMDLSEYRSKLSRITSLEQSFSNSYSVEKDVDQQLKEFNAKLKEAGIDEIIKYINECLEKA